MIKLWLTNVAPEASDDDIRNLVKTYAPELECTDLQREEGDLARAPSRSSPCRARHRSALDKACARLNGMFWKERKLSCTTTTFA